MSDAPETVGPGLYEQIPVVRPSSVVVSNNRVASERAYFVQEPETPSPADHSPLRPWGKKRPGTAPSGRPRGPDKAVPPPPEKHIQPGPGAYNTQVEWREYGVRMDLSRSPQREAAAFNGVPGPGAYECEVQGKAQLPGSATFRAHDSRVVFTNPVNDGVTEAHQAWMPVVFKGRPFSSAGARELDWGTLGADAPGPRPRDTLRGEVRKEADTRGFGTDRVFYPELAVQNPGPGTYDTEGSIRSLAVGSALKRGRDPNLWGVRITPSPDQYEKAIEETVSRALLLRTASPAFKDRGKRYQCLEREDPNPGPASCFAKLPKMESGTGKVPKGPRFTENIFCGIVPLSDTPSPAEYTTETPTTRKRVQGGQQRTSSRFQKEKVTNPGIGPGRYGKVECGLLKGSFNVGFDPAMQDPQPYRKHNDSSR
jgi:hypothetical protein